MKAGESSVRRSPITSLSTAAFLNLGVLASVLFVLLGLLAAAPAYAGGLAKPVAQAPSGTVASSTPTFAWTKVSGARTYQVRVYKGKKLLLQKTGLTKLSWRATKALPMYVKLTWRVCAASGRRVGPWSTNAAFKIDPNAPQGAVTTLQPTFTWAKVARATRYQLCIYQGAKLLVGKSGMRKTAWKTTTLLPSYVGLSWKVRASKGHHTFRWGKTFKFTVAAPAAAVALHAGDGQSAAVGSALPTAPSVLVTDAKGRPVPGVPVTFAVAAGGGSLTGASSITNASGVAAVGGLTLGTTAGTNTLTATCSGISGSPVSFRATGTAGPADAARSALTATSATITANGTSTEMVTVTAIDAYGNPVGVGGAIVTITRLSGTGTIGPVIDNGNGTYTATIIAPSTIGSGVFVATLNGIQIDGGAANQARLVVDYVAGLPATVTLNAGDGLSATVGQAVPTAPSVLVEDAYGNPVPGAGVTFQVTGGGGSVTNTTATTDSAGIATAGAWTLGTTAGANTLAAACTNLVGLPVDFTATGAPGPAVGFAFSLAGTQTNGQPFAGSDTLTAQDSYGNTATSYSAVANNVTITASPAGGTVSGLGLELGDVLDQSPDFVNGVANLSGELTFTGLAGDHTFTASSQSGGLTGTSNTIAINPGAPAQLAITTQPASGASGLPLATQPVVQLQDASGNAVAEAGVSVSASLASGPGTLSGTTTVTTDANGTATFSDLVITGTAGTNYTLTFAASGLTSAVSGNLTVTFGTAAQLAITTQPASGASGLPLATQPVVQLQDASGNAVAEAGVSVSASLASGPGTLSGTTTVTTDANGTATFSDLVITGTAGTDYTLTFAASGLTSAVSGNLTVTFGAAAQLAITTQPASGASGLPLATSPSFSSRTRAVTPSPRRESASARPSPRAPARSAARRP